MPANNTQMKRPLQPPAFPVALAYGALVLLFFAPHLLGLAAFPDSDFTRHFLPFSLFQQSALLDLRLPLWDPHTFSGHPFLADAQSAVFYPVSNALLVLTSFDRSAAARLYWLQVEAALHIFLACFFTYMLVRRLTANKMAAFIAGAVFGFSGHWLQGTKACPNRCVSCPANRVCETGYIMGQPESRQRSRAGQDRNCTWLSNYIQAGISSMAQIPASSLSTQTCSGSIRLECTPSSLHMPSTTTFAHRQK